MKWGRPAESLEEREEVATSAVSGRGWGWNSDSFAKIKVASLPPQGKAEQRTISIGLKSASERKSD